MLQKHYAMTGMMLSVLLKQDNPGQMTSKILSSKRSKWIRTA